MPQREYDISIGPDGNVEVHIAGFKGKRCLEAMKVFQEIVGDLKSRRETGEFFEPEEEVRHDVRQKH
jgi:hypothetical protein